MAPSKPIKKARKKEESSGVKPLKRKEPVASADDSHGGPVSWELGDDILSQLTESSNNISQAKDESDVSVAKKATRKRHQVAEFDQAQELAKESKLRLAETQIAEAELQDTPDTIVGFEKRVVTRGNSATVWMEYMAFHLKNGSLEGARQVVRRGLERIDFREMLERQNLWVAYLNMECLFGDKVKEVFQESLRFNKPKVMYLKMLNIFIKSKRLEDAVEVCKMAIKKLGTSKKIWNAYLRLLYQHVGDFNEAREVYSKCMSRIPKHKSVYMTTSTALLEYKYASVDRGQMMFENLLLENPKRMDIWMQYICAHIKFHLNDDSKKQSESFRAIRNLFERIITLDLKPKKMKVIFQKWLDFECNHGNEKSKQRVQQKALEYVESVEARLKP
ncbi:programmed cell death protein 11 pre-rRNA processing protein rrp5 [Babesia gibsoni]|uniref:Programmed cell death protein 11 pre-rRNA processing protein rrp5 n=1 Tax=Babesia gibsoni TaxID=33632 RepID=A0AAD8LPP1_BABGI|nr:programmed cell death protein 11 pre-rRNA processing protein rrp5 [Babesia gibsoni]